LAMHALEGLAAGSQVGPQRSAGAAWASGIGAGASAVRQQGQEQDLLKRKQAQDEYETQQKAIMNRATIAHNNASVYRDYLDSMTKQWDRDPEYANTQAVTVNARVVVGNRGAIHNRFLLGLVFVLRL